MRPLLPKHNRYDFIPLPERKDYSWPGGKRLAFVVTTNVECFAFGAGLGHDPAKTGEPQARSLRSPEIESRTRPDAPCQSRPSEMALTSRTARVDPSWSGHGLG